MVNDMYIKKLKIRNLGAIDNIDFAFSQQKTNLVIGRNATGKTTLLSSLYTLFFDDEIFSYPADNHIPCEITVINYCQ